jgi:hypothetical protein
VEKGDVYQNLLDKKSCGVNPCFCCPHIYMVKKIGFVQVCFGKQSLFRYYYSLKEDLDLNLKFLQRVFWEIIEVLGSVNNLYKFN